MLGNLLRPTQASRTCSMKRYFNPEQLYPETEAFRGGIVASNMTDRPRAAMLLLSKEPSHHKERQ